MQNLILISGIPSSGKTLAAHSLAQQYSAKVFSFEEYKDNATFERSYCVEQHVYEAIFRDMEKALRDGRNVIFDAFNLTRSARRRVFDALHEFDTHKIVYVMNTPLSECYKKNEMSFSTEDDTNILKAVADFECPQKFEGIDEIYFFHYKDMPNPPEYNKEKWENLTNRMHAFMIYNQEQKSNMLYSHLTTCEAKLKDSGKILSTAALLHDVGKLFCETHDEKNLTHFYSHANFGTYFLMCEMDLIPHQKNLTWDSMLEMLFYVNYHTKIKTLFTPNSQGKYKCLFGETRYENLLKLRQIDDESY